MKETPWSRIRGQNSVDKEGNGKPTGSVLKETIVDSVAILISVQNWHSRILLRVLSCSRMREMRREPEVPEARVPVIECLDGPARITSKELAPIHSVKSGILQNACSTSPRVDADLEKSALMRIARLMNSPAKGPKKLWQKCSGFVEDGWSNTIERRDPVVYDSSNTRQLGWVFQDMEPPKSSSILRKSSDIRKPIRCVKFTKAVARHADIRDQNPSLGMICPGEPHQRSPNAPKFEDRSQEETEWQEQGAREAAWKLAKSVLKLKEKKTKAAFFSPSENRCLPESNLKLEEREFVVDSGASNAYDQQKGLEFCWNEYLDEAV